MEIANNLLRYALRNAYFINGTAYAGKSTLVKALAEKYDGICCGENYHLELREAVDATHQPHTSYLNELKDWRDFVSRTPEEYEAWVDGGKEEITGMELTLLLGYARTGKRIFVDTNIPPHILREIADPSHVLLMLSPQETAVERFFDREDAEKQFLYRVMMELDDPQKALDNFRACIGRVNDDAHYRVFLDSGFPILWRDEERTPEETVALAERYFHLER